MNRSSLGFNEYAARIPSALPAKGLFARVIAEHRTEYEIVDAETLIAVVRGSFHRDEEFPKVGDWVRYAPTEGGGAVIEEILPRLTVIARKENDASARQVIATNVDRMLVVQGLDGDFNLRRIERYLVLAKQSGCEPIVVLTKSDIAKNPDAAIAQVKEIAPDVTVVAIAITEGIGTDAIRALLPARQTAVLVGSSGAGKSTLLNALLGADAMRTQEVRAYDSRGRHTTTHRELFIIPGGSLVIDTPGMRELGILPSDDAANEAIFAKVAAIVLECRFPDCDHDKSVGCAVIAAIEKGLIDPSQFVAYQRILREQEFEATRMSAEAERTRLAEMHARQKGYRKVQGRKYADQDDLAT